VRPVRREDVVSFAPEEQIEGAAKNLAHGPAELGIEMRKSPAAEREAAGRVFAGSAGRLHDAVEADERRGKDLAHGRSHIDAVSMAQGRGGVGRADRPTHIFLDKWAPRFPSTARPD